MMVSIREEGERGNPRQVVARPFHVWVALLLCGDFYHCMPLITGYFPFHCHSSNIRCSNMKLPRFLSSDCQDLMSTTPMISGQYTIFPVNGSKPFRVYCQVEDGDAWTVIQRRDGGLVDFYRDWSDYKSGFGRLTDEFWIGNEHLHQLTRHATYKMRIDMWDWAGEYYYAESNFVYVGSESDYYTLYAPDDYYAYSGFGGSGLRVHRGPFMTYDHQDPSMISDNCARRFHCGWWFTTCVRNANLNGRYYPGGYENISTKSRNIDDIYWHSVEQSLKKVVMRLYRTQDMPRNTKGYS